LRLYRCIRQLPVLAAHAGLHNELLNAAASPALLAHFYLHRFAHHYLLIPRRSPRPRTGRTYLLVCRAGVTCHTRGDAGLHNAATAPTGGRYHTPPRTPLRSLPTLPLPLPRLVPPYSTAVFKPRCRCAWILRVAAGAQHYPAPAYMRTPLVLPPFPPFATVYRTPAPHTSFPHAPAWFAACCTRCMHSLPVCRIAFTFFPKTRLGAAPRGRTHEHHLPCLPTHHCFLPARHLQFLVLVNHYRTHVIATPAALPLTRHAHTVTHRATLPYHLPRRLYHHHACLHAVAATRAHISPFTTHHTTGDTRRTPHAARTRRRAVPLRRISCLVCAEHAAGLPLRAVCASYHRWLSRRSRAFLPHTSCHRWDMPVTLVAAAARAVDVYVPVRRAFRRRPPVPPALWTFVARLLQYGAGSVYAIVPTLWDTPTVRVSCRYARLAATWQARFPHPAPPPTLPHPYLPHTVTALRCGGGTYSTHAFLWGTHPEPAPRTTTDSTANTCR